MGGTVTLGYDLMGNFISHQDQNNNLTRFSYDSLNRLHGRTDALLASESALFEAGGALQRFTDRKGQVGASTGSPTAYTSGIRYTWDAGNRLTLIEDGSCSGADCASFTVSASIARTYDGLDRLTRETTPQGQIDYSYYANGLRQTMTVLGLTCLLSSDRS